MRQIGFWDYTCPLHGSLERYSHADWDILLDDMEINGFNSLVLGIKWMTTGYRSQYDWLDQDPDCTAVNSDNRSLHYALQGARSRGIKTWLLVVATIYSLDYIGLTTGHPFKLPNFEPYGQTYPSGDFAYYDLDTPGLEERIDLLFSEVVELFGSETDGMVVELELCDGEAEHRIPIYNAWAQANNRPDFAEIKNIRLEPRAYPFRHWRDFTTSRRIDTFKRIETIVRQRGFTGELTSIAELDNQPSAVMGNVNFKLLKEALPNWPVVTYDSLYDRRYNRLASMDMCVHQPRLAGLEPLYLTRGVMTLEILPELGLTSLEEQWRMSLEDAAAHKPGILWFMGSDCRLDGWVCSDIKLPEWGFPDGRTARLSLMEMAGRLLS